MSFCPFSGTVGAADQGFRLVVCSLSSAPFRSTSVIASTVGEEEESVLEPLGLGASWGLRG